MSRGITGFSDNNSNTSHPAIPGATQNTNNQQPTTNNQQPTTNKRHQLFTRGYRTRLICIKSLLN
ncbi:hypothetical protein, partial [Porticoccus sp.]|uniref:hypothetical protein n=1 Tax=Porticoccus sp. TaxID=2024853 RepID=UPI003F69D9B8